MESCYHSQFRDSRWLVPWSRALPLPSWAQWGRQPKVYYLWVSEDFFMFMSVIFLALNSVLKHCLSLWCHFCCKVLFCPNQKNGTFLYAHAAFVLIRMLLLQTCRAEFIISGHRSYAPITGKEVISQASLQSHLLFLFTKPAESGRDHLL